MELVISVVIGILIVEAYAWLPKLSEWLIERAVQPLRSEDRDRCREEWMAGLNALPNTVIKFVHALSFLCAAHRINAEFFESRLNAIDALIEECGHKHSRLVVSFNAAKETLGRSQTDLRQKLDLQLSKAHVLEVPNKHKEVLQNAVRAIEGLANTYTNAIGRSAELLTVCVERSTERLNHVQGLILSASEKRDHLNNLMRRGDAPTDLLDTLMAELIGDLQTVKRIFEDDKWGDDDSLREHERIVAAIKESVARIPAARQTTEPIHSVA